MGRRGGLCVFFFLAFWQWSGMGWIGGLSGVLVFDHIYIFLFFFSCILRLSFLAWCASVLSLQSFFPLSFFLVQRIDTDTIIVQ